MVDKELRLALRMRVRIGQILRILRSPLLLHCHPHSQVRSSHEIWHVLRLLVVVLGPRGQSFWGLGRRRRPRPCSLLAPVPRPCRELLILIGSSAMLRLRQTGTSSSAMLRASHSHRFLGHARRGHAADCRQSRPTDHPKKKIPCDVQQIIQIRFGLIPFKFKHCVFRIMVRMSGVGLKVAQEKQWNKEFRAANNSKSSSDRRVQIRKCL